MGRSGRQGKGGFCAVCADAPTVRSHVLPRALFHDDATGRGAFILGRRGEGYRVTQSGRWTDGILCERHERELAAADDYGVAFCRRWRAAEASHVPETWIENPRPDLLVDFALASTWRMAAAVGCGRPSVALDQFADLIEGRLFGPGEGCDPPLTVDALAIDDGRGEPALLGMLPAPAAPGSTSWRFLVSGLCFGVDLSGSPAPDAPRVNAERRVLLTRGPPRPIDDVPGLRRSLERMTRPRTGRPKPAGPVRDGS